MGFVGCRVVGCSARWLCRPQGHFGTTAPLCYSAAGPCECVRSVTSSSSCTHYVKQRHLPTLLLSPQWYLQVPLLMILYIWQLWEKLSPSIYTLYLKNPWMLSPKPVYMLDFLQTSELCTVFFSSGKSWLFSFWGLTCCKQISTPRSSWGREIEMPEQNTLELDC